MDLASMKRRELQALCKRHGLAAGGSNADLVARLAATLSGCGGPQDKVVGVVVGKGCLKRTGGGASGGSSGAAKNVTFVLEDEAEVGVRRRSRRPRVVWSPVVAKTMGRRKSGEMLPAAEASGGRRQRKVLQGGGERAEEGVAGEAGADAPVRRFTRNAVNSGAGGVAERVARTGSRNNSAKAEEHGEKLGEAVDRKRKRLTRENAEDIVASAHVADSRRSTRSSGLLSAAAVVVEGKRSRRKAKEEEPAVQKDAQVEVSARTARSRSVAAAVVSPTVVEKKRRRKTDDVHSDGVLLAVPEVPVNDAPVTRGLRNRAVQVNDSVVEDAHAGKKLENKGQPSRPAARRHQQPPSSVGEGAQEQVAAPSKGPPLRRSRRNHSEANELLSNNNTASETNNWSRAPVEANDLKLTRRLARNASKDSIEDGVAEEDGHLGFTKRNTRSDRAKVAENVGEVSFPDSSGKASAIEMQLEVIEPVRRSRRKSVVPRGQGFQNVMGEDVEKQPVVKEPVRRSTRKYVVPAMLEKERKGLTAEMIPEAQVGRSTRKSVLPNMLDNENRDHCERSEDFQCAKGEDVEKLPAVQKPVRRSTRKSVVPTMLEKEMKGIPAETNPEAHARRSMRKSVLPNMLKNENKNHGEMVRSEDFQCAKGGGVEKQLEVKEPARQSTCKSVAPAVLEKENTGLQEEKNSEIAVRSIHKSVAPNAVDKENVDHSEMVRRKESRVRTGVQFAAPAIEVDTSENKLQVEVVMQNDEGLRRPTQRSSKHNLSGNNARPGEDQYISRDRVGEGGLKLRKRRRTSMELSCSSSNSLNTEVFDGQKSKKQQKAQTPKKMNSIEDDHEKLVRSQQQSKPRTSKGRPAKRRRTSALQEVMSVEESKADDMVIREATQDEVTNGYSEEFSSSIQENSQDNATGEEFPSAPLLGTLPEETCRVQSVNEDIHGSESGDLDKSGQNPEICHPGATESTHQCEQAQEHGDFQNDNSHLSEVRLGELDQSSSIAELVPHAGILSENKTLLDKGEVDWGAQVMQTLKAVSSEDGLGALNKSAGIAQEIRSTTAVLILEAEAPVDEGVNNNGMDSTVGIQDVGVVSLEQLLGASDKLQIVDEVAQCTRDALVMENDSRVCDGANWIDIKGTKGIENGEIALSNDSLEAFKSITVAEEVPSCTVAGFLDDGTPAKEEIGIKNNEASLSLVDTGSRGNESDGQPTKSLEVSLLEFNPNYLPTFNAETEKQSNEGCVAEVASQFLSHCDDTTITVTKYEFAWQEDIQGVSTDAKYHQPSSDRTNCNGFSIFSGSSETDAVPIDFTIGDHEEKYPASPVSDKNKVGREANANESAEKTLADIIPVVLHTKDLQHDHDHAPGKLVDILVKETGKASGSDVNSHQCIFPTERDESDNRQVHSDTVAEKSIEDAALVKCLSNDKEESSLSTTLHVEGATEDKSMFPILSDVEGISSDGRDLSFGLKFLFAEEDKESYLINDENTAVKVDCGNKSIDCKTPSFYPGSDCCLEDDDVQLIGGDADKKLDVEQGVAEEECIAEDKSMLSTLSDVDVCSSDGRHPLFGQKALFAEERTGSYLTNDACVAAEIDCKKKLGDEIVSVYLESNCSLEEKDVGLVADNPDNKLAMEQVQQDDVQEGTLEKTSLGSATPEYKHECGLPEEALLHSMQNERCSSSAEQSPFGLQSLFSQESLEESMEYGALAFATVYAKSGVDESKDCHVKCRVEKNPVSGSVPEHDTYAASKNGDCMYTSQQDNEKEGLPKSSQEEQVASDQLGLLEAANCMTEEANSEEVACEDEENRKPVHSIDINSSCEKLDANGLAEHASDISDALLSSSLIAPANDNDEVHLSSSQSQLEPTALLDEPIGCFNTEKLHQGFKQQCHKEEHASGARTSHMIEAATTNDLESGMSPLPAEERSNLRDEQLNSKLKGTEVVESGVSCDKHVSNTLEFGSAVDSVGKRTPSDSTLPKDSSMDHYQQQEPSNGFSVEKSPEECAMCWENSVSRAGDYVPGTIEKPWFDLATPDCKHEGAMSEEAVHSLKNDTGRNSSNLKQSPIGLQFLFSEENMEGSDTHDALAFPSAENGVDESNVCHFECPVENIVSSEPVSYQGSDEDLSRVKENGDCMFSSQQDNVQEGFSKSSHEKDWVASVQLDSSEDVSHIEREIIAEEVVCKEEEKGELKPCSAIDNAHERSHVDEPAEHASGVGGTQYCSSWSTPICDEVHLSSNSSQLESVDALDNLIAFSNTEVLHQDRKEECNEQNEHQVTPDIPAHCTSEAALVEGSENGITLLPAAETSVLPDKQLNTKLEGDEIVVGSGICQTGDEISTKLLSFNTKVLHQDHKEECNEHNEDQVTPDIPASDMSEPAPIEGSESGTVLLPAAETSALPDEQLDPKLEGNEVVEHSLSCNKDTTSISDTGSVENNNLSRLSKDSYMDSCHEQQIPNDLSAPKSLEEPAVCQDDTVHTDCLHEQELLSDTSAPKSPNESAIYRDDSVHMACFHEQQLPGDPSARKSPDESAICRDDSVHMDCFHEQELPSDVSAPKSPEGSAICRDDGVSESAGLCQTSGRRRVDEISTKLLGFKISSAVKGSYIAMKAPTTKQRDNLNQPALALLRNRENTPAAKTDRPGKPVPDRSAAKNSSRRALQTISGRPRDL